MYALKEELGEDKVKFENKNASNDVPMCSTIVNQFISAGADLIMANATPALQAAAAATTEIPILGTSVTEYSAALDIDNFDGIPGGNISGTSDLAPLDQQTQMIRDWFPEAKTIGLLYCSAEANSQYQVSKVKSYLEEMGYTCKNYSFTDSNDLPAVLAGVTANCDVVYVPTDNTVATNSTIIDNTCRYEKIPVIGGDTRLCASCTAATMCIEYYDLGVATGKMAAKILTDEADISQMPVGYAEAFYVYNPEICAYLGVTPPSDAYMALPE